MEASAQCPAKSFIGEAVTAGLKQLSMKNIITKILTTLLFFKNPSPLTIFGNNSELAQKLADLFNVKYWLLLR
jgi:hypothetical protein